ncbi:tryptophan ABC transporter substrate-binding protein [Streptococcus sp. DD12]|uniref:tryptophan ABC transporter substrate-binding protein n=1 Tax=Streptococcus sp. DD12 TaxID=1777880 RepID=UPI0007919FF0|nr:tryptophan ABC transporter substrate-binding protein [Streptococcus sp. DD12]KXT77000.1 ABC transporter substrate-binding protein [Streptococcus sp. DD12]
MKNRRLIGTLVLFALALFGAYLYPLVSPSSGGATTKTVKVGVLQFTSHEALDQIYQGILAGLKEEGYSGKAVKVQFMNAQGDQSRIQTMSQQLVADKNDVLIGIATPAAQGLAAATKSIPIVMGAVTDPIGAKLMTNLDKPTANITGVSDQTPIAETLDLMGQITPNIKTIGVLSASSEDNSPSQVKTFKKLAEKKGYKVVEYSVPSTNEVATTMSVMVGKVDAIWLPIDNTIASAFSTVVSAAQTAHIPIYPSVDTMVQEGGLASVSLDQYQLGVETGKMAAKVLKGQKVANLPVERYSKGTPVLNQKVADQLGITFPSQVLKKATQVIKE